MFFYVYFGRLRDNAVEQDEAIVQAVDQLNLAECYRFGMCDVEKYEKKAEEWYSKASA